MFALFERLLKPTDISDGAAGPAWAARVLLAFRAPGERRCSLRCSLPASRTRSSTRPIPIFFGRVVTLVTRANPETLVHRARPPAADHGAGAADCAAFHADDAEPARQPGDRRQRIQPHPLAEPLARGAPVVGVLPERFRRPHRNARDADGAGDPRDDRLAHHRRLVHPGLRHQRADPARACGYLARAPDRPLVRRLSDAFCACWCRACATARRRCPRRARCSRAASSTATPTSSP